MEFTLEHTSGKARACTIKTAHSTIKTPVFMPVGTLGTIKALDMQDELQCKYTGGTVLHLYMSEKISSPEACRKLVKNVISNYRLPYITITPVFSVCEKHGYINGEHEYCPYCDEELINEYEKEIL